MKVLLVRPFQRCWRPMDIIPFLAVSLGYFCCHPASLAGVALCCVVPTCASTLCFGLSSLGVWCCRSRFVLHSKYLVTSAPLADALPPLLLEQILCRRRHFGLPTQADDLLLSA
jgi:hypothetical protein